MIPCTYLVRKSPPVTDIKICLLCIWIFVLFHEYFLKTGIVNYLNNTGILKGVIN